MGNNWWLKFGFVFFLVVMSIRSLVPTFAFQKADFVPDFKVEKDEKGNVKYEKYESGKNKGRFLKDENGQKIPVFVRDEKTALCQAEFERDPKTKKYRKDKNGKFIPKRLKVPVRNTDGSLKKVKGKVVFKNALMTDAIWERCYLPNWYKKLFPYKKKIRLGLDLQGGTHLVLRVDVEKAIANKAARLSDDMATFLLQKQMIQKTGDVFHDPDKTEIEITLISAEQSFRAWHSKLQKQLLTAGVIAKREDVVYKSGSNVITVTLKSEKSANKLKSTAKSVSSFFSIEGSGKTYALRTRSALSSLFRNEVEKRWDYLKTAATDKPNFYRITFKDDYKKKARESAISQAIDTIRSRVDSLGVSEPAITQYGDTEIVVQLPGLKNPKRAKELIGKTALLSFHIVEDDAPEADKIFNEMKKDKQKSITSTSSSYQRPNGDSGIDRMFYSSDKVALVKWMKKWNKVLSRKYRKYRLYIGPYEQSSDSTLDKKELPWRTYLLHAKADITGDDLEEARPQQDPDSQRPEVGLKFTNKGGYIFGKMTGAHVGHRFAIVLENKVDSAPVIQTKIGGGSARITLGGSKSFDESMQDAKDLAFVLKSGSLPAPVDVLYEKTIGAALGLESIKRGSLSLLVGFCLVILFMLISYRASGLNANIALLLNMLFVMAVMASFGATLTLPGMAGILLTIGMAVDANILIFERIREELRSGKAIRVAVASGYEKAFVTIIDANITTAIAGIVLYQYGSGPIRGFAVTLLIGIGCSVFTALVVTRLFFDIFTRRNLRSLSI